MTAVSLAPGAARSPLARAALAADEIVFGVERLMIAVFLIAAASTVTIDFGYGLLKRDYSRDVPAAVLPWLGHIVLAVTFLVMWAACWSAEQQRGKPFFGQKYLGSAFVAVLATSALGLTALTIVRIGSLTFYVTGYALVCVALFAWLHRTRGLSWKDWLALALVTPAFLYFAFTHIPEEYAWSKEFSGLLILWIGLFGASVCAKTGAHLRIEALEKLAPEPARKYVRALGFLSAAALCAFMVLLGYVYLFTPETGFYYVSQPLSQTKIPLWFELIAVPIAFGLACARFVASAVSVVMGGSYGAPTNLEAGEMADGMAAEPKAPSPLRRAIYPALWALVVVLPFLGKGPTLVAVILGLALIGAPIFVVLGAVVVSCFVLWMDVQPWASTAQLQELALVERITTLADNQTLLTVPFFVMSGSIMGRGQISRRLVDFSMGLVGWLPGGLAVAAVLACAIFAAISGSSPATVVAVGGVMAPALIAQGYQDRFSHGIVTSAGSLGILVPPSIPMVVYAIVAPTPKVGPPELQVPMRVEELFAAGYGPGLVIGLVLSVFAVVYGIRRKLPRQPFSAKKLLAALVEGRWALAFPVLMVLGVKYLTAVELACFSVVYAIFVEVVPHRALKPSDVPKVLSETATLLGAFLVILVMAIAFGEYIERSRLATGLIEQVHELDLDQWQILLVINVILLIVGCLLDIMSAIFIFGPLLAPIAFAAGIHPIHFAIIFIVNLEIGYLTPPVGLNLFVASTLFKKPVEYMIRATLPFLAMMLVALTIVTYDGGWVSVEVGRRLLGLGPAPEMIVEPEPPEVEGGAEGGGSIEEPETPAENRVLNLEEMMLLEELTRDAGAGEPAPEGAPAPLPEPSPAPLPEPSPELEPSPPPAPDDAPAEAPRPRPRRPMGGASEPPDSLMPAPEPRPDPEPQPDEP
jgi:C4-dicarboxylate transporter DctM subunit